MPEIAVNRKLVRLFLPRDKYVIVRLKLQSREQMGACHCRSFYIYIMQIYLRSWKRRLFCLWFLFTSLKTSVNATMPGTDCAFYGCHTSRKSQISLFEILVMRAANSEHTEALKTKAREMKNGSH